MSFLIKGFCYNTLHRLVQCVHRKPLSLHNLWFAAIKYGILWMWAEGQRFRCSFANVCCLYVTLTLLCKGNQNLGYRNNDKHIFLQKQKFKSIILFVESGQKTKTNVALGVGGAHLQSQHSGGRDRLVSVSLRSATKWELPINK